MFTDKQFIDVRSPQEFEEYTLPGAVNIPLFSNEERAHIGIIYKNLGKEKAIEEGLKVIGPKLQQFYVEMKKVKEASPGKEFIVFCWRGGMRSKSFVSTMNMLGISCTQLSGGIRSYRKEITAAFEKEKEKQRDYIVLAGGTGTAKTMILNKLQQEGYPVIDLEGLANHRGSAFGQIGLTRRTQKQFDLLLWQRLNELGDSPYVIIEAEDKRIGDIFLPEFIMEGKERGKRIEIKLPLEERISVLTETYQPKTYHQEMMRAIKRIERKLDPSIREELKESMENHHFRKACELLLMYYYDPRYQHAYDKYEEKPVLLEALSTKEIYEKLKFMIPSLWQKRHPC